MRWSEVAPEGERCVVDYEWNEREESEAKGLHILLGHPIPPILPSHIFDRGTHLLHVETLKPLPA